ncbi:MAG: hypothetical protein F4X26_09850 [Chloroflexi bacterium]|nr:hypothetical protein [Chloroflexota bacterium]
MTDDERDREKIRAAEERLFAGSAFRSNGKLTVTDLAVEADLKRSKLYDTHRDLVELFLARVRAQGSTPEAYQTLEDKNTRLSEQHEHDRRALRQAKADLKRMACVVQVLTRENAQLEERLRGEASNVRGIREPRSAS